MAKVVIKGLTKTFGETVAVKDFDLEVKDKSFVVMLGPSGCGKTTTLRCIAGLETPDEGEIYIGDRLVNHLPPKDRDAAMVFQNYALYPHMTVFNNIAFPLKMRKVQKGEIKKRVYETADLLRIRHLLNRKPNQLSGGEMQRTALGRAIVRDPQVFLMDEPLSNLDAKLRLYMRVELKRLQKDIGVTTVYVTHDQVEAMTLADKVAIMNDGMLQQFGNAVEIFRHPASIFVAGFIGSPPMNLIQCNLTEGDEGVYLDAGSFTLTIPDNISELLKEKASGTELILGLRPEDIYIAKRQTPEAVMEGEIYVTEPLGSETIVDIQVGDNLVKANVDPDFIGRIGEKIWLSINKEKIHLFDKKTEKAIY